jgi:radical SAM superfamily enzyme YgiQ (UPF0313 family)
MRNIFILDDTFNIKASAVHEFSRLVIDRKLNIRWAFRGRAAGLDEETLKTAKQAGLAHISIGVEDFTDEGLKLIRKGITVDQVRRAFKLSREYGIKTTANFIIGLPHNQQWDRQMLLIDFIREISPTTIQTFVLVLIPGSEIYEDAVRSGVITGQEWIAQAHHPSPHFEIPGWHGDMTIKDQFRINSLINRWFYSRPSYLARQILETRSMSELRVKARVAHTLLRTAVSQR